MTVDADSVLEKVVAAVQAVGRTVSLTTYVDTYSTATGKTTRTATTMSVLASPPLAQERSVDTDSQPRGSSRMIVPVQAALTSAPVVGCKVSTGGVVYTATAVSRLEIGDTLLAYALTLQQGAPS